jgi:putative peptidoglycan lipid II flippase
MLFHRMGVAGLAIASDVGILLHTVALAWLLNRSGLVRLREMEWMELTKSLATAGMAAIACYATARLIVVNGSRRADLLSLALISGAWMASVGLGLWITRSKLPSELRRRRAPAQPNVTAPEPLVERTTGGLEP